MADNERTRLAGAASIVREEDLEDLEGLQREISNRVEKARGDGRAFMMAQYVRLLAIITGEVARLRKRFDREALAHHRAEHRLLKEQQRGQGSEQ
jgi:phage terminase Nu1 subunit (DNA packaging protein)